MGIYWIRCVKGQSGDDVRCKFLLGWDSEDFEVISLLLGIRVSLEGQRWNGGELDGLGRRRGGPVPSMIWMLTLAISVLVLVPVPVSCIPFFGPDF